MIPNPGISSFDDDSPNPNHHFHHLSPHLWNLWQEISDPCRSLLSLHPNQLHQKTAFRVWAWLGHLPGQVCGFFRPDPGSWWILISWKSTSWHKDNREHWSCASNPIPLTLKKHCMVPNMCTVSPLSNDGFSGMLSSFPKHCCLQRCFMMFLSLIKILPKILS